MEQDIAVRLMILEVKYEQGIPDEFQGFLKKYLNLMWVVGFDAGRKDVYARYSKKKTAIIQRDKNGGDDHDDPVVGAATKADGDGPEKKDHVPGIFDGRPEPDSPAAYIWDRPRSPPVASLQ